MFIVQMIFRNWNARFIKPTVFAIHQKTLYVQRIVLSNDFYDNLYTEIMFLTVAHGRSKKRKRKKFIKSEIRLITAAFNLFVNHYL